MVTTPGNEALVREPCAASLTLRPDRLALEPRPLAIRAFAERLELADTTNALTAERILQSWPMRGTAAALSRIELARLVAERAADAKP